ncbi:DUF1127 domain-containing protein [Sulfitobacter sp. HNIBRBA2951]|uniref:DUF1127 domain-containing protein n=1 Tax=Sulfitobacter aquimarinus TaxID=3158557 RepID=UPI0032DE3328
MAITRSISGLDAVSDAAHAFFHQKWDALLKTLERRRVCRTTRGELAILSDRELRDLGIPRSNIKRLALEAANGV